MVTKHTPHKFAKNTKTRTEIADYMTTSIISVEPDTTIFDTAKLLTEKHIGKKQGSTPSCHRRRQNCRDNFG